MYILLFYIVIWICGWDTVVCVLITQRGSNPGRCGDIFSVLQNVPTGLGRGGGWHRGFWWGKAADVED